jgi:ArsR family transcriptional regulator
MREALQVAQPTVSKHLKLLEDAGLVTFLKDGTWVNYQLTDGGNSPYVASLLGNLRHWMEDDPQIADLIEKLPTIRRENICKR